MPYQFNKLTHFLQNTTPKSIDGWDWIANSAQRILEVCPISELDSISGQNFEDGNWNTIVRQGDC